MPSRWRRTGGAAQVRYRALGTTLAGKIAERLSHLETGSDVATLQDLIQNPNYLAYKFNFSTEHIEFMPVTRSEIRAANSLSRQDIDPNRGLIPAPLSDFAPLLMSAHHSLFANPPRFIFHTAFCSSTFLSRCLDIDGVSVSLREPQILLDAANARRLQWRSRTTGLSHQDLARLGLILLRKHAGPSEKLVIKPVNSVNNIIRELVELIVPTRSLMLYTDARNFLLSTLKKGEESKYAVRAMFDLIRCDFPQLANLRLTDAVHMTDLRAIMTLWRLQIEQAGQALQAYAPSGQMASVYGERLIENLPETLRAANRFLGLDIPQERMDDIVSSNSRFDDAKNAGRKFSAERRRQAYAKVEEFYGEELDNGLRWMVRNNPGTALKPQLTGALS